MTATIAFVTGVARSGTSALTQLLNAHPEVCIGMERFKFRFLREKIADSRFFQADRFFHFVPEDTNLVPAAGNRWHAFYRKMKGKYDTAKVVGDKVSASANNLLVDAFPHSRIIYIVRRVERVASSWQVRTDNPDDGNWPARRTAEAAVKMWNVQNRKVLGFVREDPSRWLVIDYERVFSDPGELTRLQEFLGVENAPEVAASHSRSKLKYESEIRDKAMAISDEVVNTIRKRADFDSYERLLDLSHSTVGLRER